MNRPQVSQRIINVFAEIVDKQDAKGLAKYGRSIDDAVDEEYDWNEMVVEECADAFKYLVRQNMKLSKQYQKALEGNRKLQLENDVLQNQSKEWKRISKLVIDFVHSYDPELALSVKNIIEKSSI